MSIASVINKAEIQIYSTLISVMSGINQLKAGEPQIAKSVVQEMPQIDFTPGLADAEATDQPSSAKWESIQQTLLSLVLWIILGFAAGFLIGMTGAG